MTNSEAEPGAEHAILLKMLWQDTCVIYSFNMKRQPLLLGWEEQVAARF